MKAIQLTHFADDGNLAFVEDAPRPQLEPKSNQLLVKVLACALNPGDCHVMRGSVSLFVKPKSFPYSPGMDVCGVVEEVGEYCRGFSKGDRVAVVLGPVPNHGDLEEFLLCDADQATLAPISLTPIEVASLPIAGTTAIAATKAAKVGAGSRIIVLGASGGVGSLVIQIAKGLGASFIAATTTNGEMVKSLGADSVVDYRTAKWWEELDGEKFDAVIDCVGCNDSWANCDRLLARRGRYVAVSSGSDPRVRSIGELASFVGSWLWRVLSPFSATYTMVSCFPTGEDVRAVMDLAEQGQLRAVLDPCTPCHFSLAGALQAVARQRSRRAKGKLVFQISPELN